MPRYGVIDLGSNSIRLVIFEIKEGVRNPYTKKDFHSLINDKVVAGLSAYVQDSVFTPSGIAKATEVLSGHLTRARNLKCEEVHIFATAVLRNCINSHEAVDAISAAIGEPIDVLSAKEEAHLGFVGATCDSTVLQGTLIDVGGGSTELSRITQDHDLNGVSIPQGSVSSYAQFVDTILPTREEMHAIENAFVCRLAKLDNIEAYYTQHLYGIGGAPRAALKLYRATCDKTYQSKTLNVDQIDSVLSLLAYNPHDFAHLAVKVTPDRLHTLIPGCLIIITLLRELSAQTIEICKHGVREGYLIERILEPNKKMKPGKTELSR